MKSSAIPHVERLAADCCLLLLTVVAQSTPPVDTVYNSTTNSSLEWFFFSWCSQTTLEYIRGEPCRQNMVVYKNASCFDGVFYVFAVSSSGQLRTGVPLQISSNCYLRTGALKYSMDKCNRKLSLLKKVSAVLVFRLELTTMAWLSAGWHNI